LDHTIRRLEERDREQVLEAVRATKNFNTDEVAIADELIEIVLSQPDQKDYFAFVCEDQSGAAVSGFLLLGPTPATTGTYDMYWIVVHPAYQGQGVAQALDNYAVSFVNERKGYWLIAETSSQTSYERPRAFYVKQGYSVLARIPDYYKPGDDLIVFGKRVGRIVGDPSRIESAAVKAELSELN
jgi:ribosomal protein S18 acetylase RimI-like enzyme